MTLMKACHKCHYGICGILLTKKFLSIAILMIVSEVVFFVFFRAKDSGDLLKIVCYSIFRAKKAQRNLTIK